VNGLPYYPRYPRDLFEGTAGMPFEMKGAYGLVLDLIYMMGERGLPDDSQFIAGHLGCSVRKWNSLRKGLIERGKLHVENGIISNFRADKEKITQRKLRDKNAENARRPRKNKDLQQPNASHTDTDTERDTEEANASSGGGAAAVDATREAIWKRGVPFLCERGVPEKQARTCIGRWLRDHGSGPLFEALAEAAKAGTGDPVPYIEAVLNQPEIDVAELVRSAAKRFAHEK